MSLHLIPAVSGSHLEQRCNFVRHIPQHEKAICVPNETESVSATRLAVMLMPICGKLFLGCK